jgi:hypothetical protein
MCDITHISSSQLGSASYSKQVAEHVTHDLGEDMILTVRDLEQVPLPHIDHDFVAATSLEPKSSPQSTNGQPQKGLWDGIQMGVHNHTVWRKVLGAVLEPRTFADENGMIEYLHRYRHDLPRAVWIKNEPLPPLGNGR